MRARFFFNAILIKICNQRKNFYTVFTICNADFYKRDATLANN